jgi:urocanate hydratase
MSRPNGRQKRAIEGLATALQECFDVSIEVAEKRFEQRMESRFEKIDTRLEKQDDTLRMIWTQCGGKADQRLPIDD